MTFDEFRQSVDAAEEPPTELSPELRALWLTKADRWEEAHDIAQDIPTKSGSWIHGLLHAIEGDFGNSAYWYHQAGEPTITAAGIDEEWDRLVKAHLVG